jgi:hypothetical protein
MIISTHSASSRFEDTESGMHKSSWYWWKKNVLNAQGAFSNVTRKYLSRSSTSNEHEWFANSRSNVMILFRLLIFTSFQPFTQRGAAPSH